MRLRRLLVLGVYKMLSLTRLISFCNNSSNYSSVLMFHRVHGSADNGDDDALSTPVEVFDSMMCSISRAYHIIPLRTLVEKIRRREDVPHMSVAITFDDGYRDNFLVAAPILQKYGASATFFVTSDYIGTERVFPWDNESKQKHPIMTWDDVRGLVQMGFEIGCHTANHYNLSDIGKDVAAYEILESKKRIEAEINSNVTLFAYPFGGKNHISSECMQAVKEAGFDCCCHGYGGKISVDSDLYDLPRVPAYPSMNELLMDIDGFITYLDGEMVVKLPFCKGITRRGKAK